MFADEDEPDANRFDDLNKDLYDPVPNDQCLYGKASFWDGRYVLVGRQVTFTQT